MGKETSQKKTKRSMLRVLYRYVQKQILKAYRWAKVLLHVNHQESRPEIGLQLSTLPVF